VLLLDFFRRLISTDFMPHAACLREPGLITLHAASDSVIALSYVLIPAALLLFVSRRRDLAFPWMFTLFGIFILGCGATHVLAVVTLWTPIYRLDGALKVLTALASMGTAMMLFRILPQLLRIPSPAQLRGEIQERERAELEIRQMNARLEEAAATAQIANRAKSTFLSTMSHEIRTPMNAIMGYAQLMQRDPALGPVAKANLEIIGRSGEHLLTLINDVLDMSKIEAGHSELNPVTFNLDKVLRDLAAMFRLRAEAKALRFEMLVDGESAPYVAADEGKLRQVLINLLGNAIKFTKRGCVQLHVTLETRNADQLWLAGSVEDTGLGISDEEQKTLFEPFHQTRRALIAQEGTGLGLAISRKHARLMGGDITVSSNPGHGSVFRFEIPITRGDGPVAVPRGAQRRVIGLRTGTKGSSVLVVDDQPESRDWLMKLLTFIGFSVRGADNGEAALRTWEEWKPSLILMDVHMPVMDGLEATRRIKADPRGRETAIVALTASAMDDDRRAVFQSGADDFLAKPCREDELLEKLSAHLAVAYDYEEVEAREGQSGRLAALNAGKLAQLPRELVQELLEATLNGDKKLLNATILKVSETEDPEYARGLQELADKYEYDALTHLLQEAARGS
jgi:signal transduction histidine kinase/DNA-binding response OmpR family regulator